MRKKNAGKIAALIATSALLGGSWFGPLGLINNQNITEEYNKAISEKAESQRGCRMCGETKNI